MLSLKDGLLARVAKMNLQFLAPVTIAGIKICTKGLALIGGDKYELVS